MGNILKFPSPGAGRERENEPRILEDGKFYDLHPPANIGGELYDKVQCEYRVPNSLDEYVVKGIPRGETTIKSFVLRFTHDRGLTPVESEKQDFDLE